MDEKDAQVRFGGRFTSKAFADGEATREGAERVHAVEVKVCGVKGARDTLDTVAIHGVRRRR